MQKLNFHNTFDIHKMCYVLITNFLSNHTARNWVCSHGYEYMGDMYKKKLHRYEEEIGMNREYKPLVSLITSLLQKEIYIEKVFSREISSD